MRWVSFAAFVSYLKGTDNSIRDITIDKAAPYRQIFGSPEKVKCSFCCVDSYQ